jgi:sirohydrochlorin ferrochelatase
MKAALLVSHGSRSPQTKKEAADLVERLRARGAADIVEFAFLEIESPSIPEGIDMCAAKGAGEIVVLLNFLNSGRHVDLDIPDIAQKARLKYPAITISVTKPVGQHPKIEDLLLDLLRP